MNKEKELDQKLEETVSQEMVKEEKPEELSADDLEALGMVIPPSVGEVDPNAPVIDADYVNMGTQDLSDQAQAVADTYVDNLLASMTPVQKEEFQKRMLKLANKRERQKEALERRKIKNHLKNKAARKARKIQRSHSK